MDSQEEMKEKAQREAERFQVGSKWRSYLGAIFLMAITAIGPGFLMQTTVFTQTSGASFGFIIIASVIIDIIVQINVWRIIVASGKRGQEIGNMVLPGLGYFIALLIVIGGLCFNIGNIAGAALGLNVLFGISVKPAALICGIIALSIFCFKSIGKIMDAFVSSFGIVRILLAVFVAVAAMPPVHEAAIKSIMPDQIDTMALVTLVGGTVGGYITFAGGHRLLDSGVKGLQSVPQATRSAVTGILITGVMRIVLFLGALGVIVHGYFIDPSNPAASVFQAAAGDIGYKLFGIVIWSAGTTSVIGCAYTSVSFLKSFSDKIDAYYSKIIIGFIIFSTAIFIFIGQPVKVLILVGTINGFILPLALASILIGAYNPRIVGSYRHPKWMAASGLAVVLAMGYMSIMTFIDKIIK